MTDHCANHDANTAAVACNAAKIGTIQNDVTGLWAASRVQDQRHAENVGEIAGIKANLQAQRNIMDGLGERIDGIETKLETLVEAVARARGAIWIVSVAIPVITAVSVALINHYFGK